MGRIAVHEFITLDGVIENPAWSLGYPFDSTIGGAIAGIMSDSTAILLGSRSHEQPA